ncbi:hypothetical protein [Metabacillus fastidiosus]|uniref:hypothetical protein n=1 Tax=Metabacillus fastidiosus TaxID=1458 RepID=UPI003D2DD7C9
MQTTCDECGKEFHIIPREHKHTYHIIETYFRCIHCGKRYTSFVMDKEARQLQKEIKEFSKQKRKLYNPNMTEEEYKKAVDDHHAKLDAMKQELKERMDKLKEQVMNEA